MNQTLISFDSVLTTAGRWKHDEFFHVWEGDLKNVLNQAVVFSKVFSLPFNVTCFLSVCVRNGFCANMV